MNNEINYKNINKKFIISDIKSDGVEMNSEILQYLQKKEYILFLTSTSINDEFIKAWYANDKYKWTAQDIYDCKHKAKLLSKEFVDYISTM